MNTIIHYKEGDDVIESFKKTKNLPYTVKDLILIGNFKNGYNQKLLKNYIAISTDGNTVQLFINRSDCVDRILESALNTLIEEYPYDTDIKAIIDLSKKDFNKTVHTLCKFGFSSPGINKSEKLLILSRKNIPGKKSKNFQQNIKKVVYMLENFVHNNTKNSCELTVKLSRDAIDTLHSLVNQSFFMKNDDQIQREFSGVFQISNVNNTDGKLEVLLEIDTEKISSGAEDEVDGFEYPFTFHTHPRNTYDIQEVKYAWPSIDDIKTVMHIIFKSNGLVHVLASKEGLYIISVGERWIDRIKNLPDNSNLSHYKIPYPMKDEGEPLTPEEYVYKINQNQDLPLEIQYFSWSDAHEDIEIYIRGMEQDGVSYCKLDVF